MRSIPQAALIASRVLAFMVGLGAVLTSARAEDEDPATSESKALGKVVAFLEPGCPIARYHTATLRKCHERFGPLGITFEGHIPNPLATKTSAARYTETYELPFPVHPDASMRLARDKRVTVVPEVLVYDKDGRLVYRGRIDDAFAGVGKRKPITRCHDLADTLVALVEGQKLTPRSTKPVGCTLTFPPSPKPSSVPSP